MASAGSPEGSRLKEFFLMTFAFSWLIYAPGALEGLRVVNLGLSDTILTILNVVGGMGPSLSAMVLVYRSGGRSGVIDLLRRGIDPRGIPARWWAVLLLVFPVLGLTSVFLDYLVTGAVPEIPLFTRPLMVLAYLIGGFIVPIGNHWREEFGWRGYALPSLQKRWGALGASLVTGVAWGLWHLPLFFFSNTQQVYGRISIPTFLAMTTLLSCVITWIYNGTGGSLFSAMVAHFLAGGGEVMIPRTDTAYGQYIYLLLEAALVLIVLLRSGFRAEKASHSQTS